MMKERKNIQTIDARNELVNIFKEDDFEDIGNAILERFDGKKLTKDALVNLDIEYFCFLTRVVLRFRNRVADVVFENSEEKGVEFDTIEFEADRRIITHRGKSRQVSPNEYETISILYKNKNQIVPKDTVSCFRQNVVRLRQKFPKLNISTERGVGYKLII